MTLTKHKQFDRGVEQLEEEGAIQVFLSSTAAQREPILAAVGELQFDVVVARLRAEYGVEAALERPTAARAGSWATRAPSRACSGRTSVACGRSRQDRLVALFASTHAIEYFVKENPDVELSAIG